MPWQQVSPSRYERDFSMMEKFYRAIAASGAHLQKQHYLISSCVQVKTAPSVSELQQAWKGLRYQHPQIAMVADESTSRFVYTTPSPEDLETWVQETLIVHTEADCSADKLHTHLPISPFFMLHYIPATRQLLFRIPHWRTDGIGLLHLQDALFSILAKGPQEFKFDGSESAHLVPPLEEVANLPSEITLDMGTASDMELGVLLTGGATLSVPTKPSPLPENTRRVGIVLPQNLTQDLITASKKRGFTVTTAVHAALILLTRARAQSPTGRYACSNPVSVRKYLPEPWNGAAGALGLYHTGLTCSIDGQDFDTVATYMKNNYGRDIPATFTFMPDFVQKVGGMLGAPLEITCQLPGNPDLSSLGVINDYLQSRYTGEATTIEIEDWWIGVQLLNRVLQGYVWTLDGHMHLQACFNDAFYDQPWVQQFLEDWKSVLVKELLG